MIDYVNRLGLA